MRGVRWIPRWIPVTLVTFAALIVACGGGSGPAGPDEMPAAEREAHLRAMKDRVDDPRQLLHMTIPEIAMLPQFPRAYTRQQFVEISALEQRGVTVEGFVARLRQMAPLIPRDPVADPPDPPQGLCIYMERLPRVRPFHGAGRAGRA